MKRKEKVLTLEEIKEKLIQLNREFWIHSEPLMGFIPTNEGPKLLPLSPVVENGIQLLFLADIGDYSFELTLECIEHLQSVYRGLPWKAVLGVEMKYPFLKNPHFLDRFRTWKSFASIPFFYDSSGDWFSHFKPQSIPSVSILQRGTLMEQIPLLPNITSATRKLESILQDAFRIEDPGLPLLEITDTKYKHLFDRRIHSSRELIATGTWIQANDSIVSEDSNASLSLNFEGSNLRLLSMTHPNARDLTRFVITVNDEPLPQSHFGASVRLGEKGVAFAEVNKTSGLYELIHAPAPLKGTVKIKFLNAVENPVIVYGLRAS